MPKKGQPQDNRRFGRGDLFEEERKGKERIKINHTRRTGGRGRSSRCPPPSLGGGTWAGKRNVTRRLRKSTAEYVGKTAVVVLRLSLVSTQAVAGACKREVPTGESSHARINSSFRSSRSKTSTRRIRPENTVRPDHTRGITHTWGTGTHLVRPTNAAATCRRARQKIYAASILVPLGKATSTPTKTNQKSTYT